MPWRGAYRPSSEIVMSQPLDSQERRPTWRKRRIAANPIPYWSRNGRVDKSREVLEEAFDDFAAIGFTAVKADVPDNLTAAEYLEWIGGYGLEPALSLFNSPFDETIDITEEIERAKRFAATQVGLGLDRTMVSSSLCRNE